MKHFFHNFVFCCVLLVGSSGPSDLQAWTPGTGTPLAAAGFTVDATSRRDVLAYYNTVFPASESYGTDMAWTGNIPTGVAGTTSAAFKEDVRRRINFYRALAGMPGDITLDSTKNGKCQAAALMFSANNAVSHTPPSNWFFYSANAAEAASSSNIGLGSYGAGVIDSYMRDPGSGNNSAGHRRWLLYSRAQEMGTGDVPAGGGFNSANALWVIGNFKAAPAPQFVAWPNRGFTPASLVPARWSLSYPNADFSSATVTMTQGVSAITTSIISNADTGLGDNSIVWVPDVIPATAGADTPIDVTVSGISGAGVPASYSYTVTLFDPAILGESIIVSGSSTPPTGGANYTFNSIAQADSYELKVSTGSDAAWTEGAEDSTASLITTSTTGSYALRQTGLVESGAKAFHLAFADFTDQSFTVKRDLIPSASSELQFSDRGRFATITSTLDAEVSTDNGGTWTSVFSRSGVGLSSDLWDANWINRGISLAAYAGQVIQVRFILRSNGQSAVIDTSVNSGFFIDDVTVSDGTQLVSNTTTPMAANATSFTLDAGTAGTTLSGGTSYYLRIRPNVGTHWFAFGPATLVTAQAPNGYATWISSQYSAVTEGTMGDHDHDGLGNGIEYAFGLNPTLPTPANSLPEPARNGNTYAVSYSTPSGVAGVTYGAEYSTNLVDWNPIADTGSGSTHIFSVNITNLTRVFFRHKVDIAP